MRIGIYDPYLDDMGGGEKYMLSIAACLAEKNNVDIFWDKPSDLEIVLRRFSIDLTNVKLVPNIFAKNVFLSKRLLESKKYDAIIYLSDGSIPVLLSKKLFIHIQQPFPALHPSIKSRIKLSRVDKVFCNSYFTKSFIDHELGVESIVIYPPVQLHPKKIEKENIILHVGRFRVTNINNTDYKKQQVMIDTFKKISKKIPKWKLVIASGVKEEDFDEFDQMKSSAKDYPIEFLVNKSNSELWETYSAAKIYWHASGYGENLQKHPEAAEHFGISTVEAMGAGAVPVVINAGGQKEIIEDGLSGFLWDTLGDLEDKTIMLANDSDILEKMANEAKIRAKDFAGERFCEEISKLISE